MLIGLSIRDVVLIEALDLAVGPGLTALTGETGAGKSIILDALGMATGARADIGLVRRGAAQATATAIFAPVAGHAVWAVLAERGFDSDPGEDLVLRRQLTADGRSRAYVNDQAASVGVLRALGEHLLEVHGQHETVGLLDSRTHRPLLDAFGGLQGLVAETVAAWTRRRDARAAAEALREHTARGAAEAEELAERLAELDRLNPREGEDLELTEQRALLSSAEKAMADISSAREQLGSARNSGGLSQRLSQALRALERARERAVAAGVAADGPAVTRLTEAAGALDRAMLEAEEASAAIDRAAAAFDFEPDKLEKAEERLFALRAAGRKLGVTVDALPAARTEIAARLRAVESADEAQREADAAARAAEAAYVQVAGALSAARRDAGETLARRLALELAPLKLDRARFQVAITPLPDDRAGRDGADRVEFEISTNPGAPFGPLGAIASGGELARFSLALKAVLAGRGGTLATPVMIFDEVDQGVGGAVADAVGLRLKRLAITAQVLVVTHSPQVAARADAHWRVAKRGGEQLATVVDDLPPALREEEIARMLAGAEVTDAARAAARALIDA